MFSKNLWDPRNVCCFKKGDISFSEGIKPVVVVARRTGGRI